MTSSVAVVANVGLPHFDNRFDGYPDIVLQVYTFLPTSLMGMMRGTFILLLELEKGAVVEGHSRLHRVPSCPGDNDDRTGCLASRT